eukprot:scaffold20204_cov122-Amphora_coffeaeformis.AAC.3
MTTAKPRQSVLRATPATAHSNYYFLYWNSCHDKNKTTTAAADAAAAITTTTTTTCNVSEYLNTIVIITTFVCTCSHCCAAVSHDDRV